MWRLIIPLLLEPILSSASGSASALLAASSQSAGPGGRLSAGQEPLDRGEVTPRLPAEAVPVLAPQCNGRERSELKELGLLVWRPCAGYWIRFVRFQLVFPLMLIISNRNLPLHLLNGILPLLGFSFAASDFRSGGPCWNVSWTQGQKHSWGALTGQRNRCHTFSWICAPCGDALWSEGWHDFLAAVLWRLVPATQECQGRQPLLGKVPLCAKEQSWPCEPEQPGPTRHEWPTSVWWNGGGTWRHVCLRA